ncbi:MAG TPA: aminodeoxychorismate/anthranilate synthase component II [Bacteroidia bacterium]|jgi:anthranilate synthase component 2|nr:aminodeoxychorismate/anthranilate synthase component II [Bacteroidia bacterium]
MRVLLIDNYDSFTYNLYQLAGDLLLQQSPTNVLDVIRNDKISLTEIKKKYDKVILSPGPGNPADKAYFGVCAEILLNPEKDLPVFGVCLGMQGIAHYYGGKVIRAPHPMHGKTSPIKHDDKGVFKDIPQLVNVMRYHSLIVEDSSLPDCLEITAQTSDSTEEIMGLRHKQYPVEGIQFHPESFATQEGNTMLKNFLFMS